MMRGIIFALAFALVGSQQYEPSFSHGKTYVYQYEGVILTGLPENGLAKGGLKITSKVQIGSVGQRKHLLKIISPQIQEYSGIWPNAQFIPARKLTRKLNAQLSKPVEFDYSHGRVGNIYAQADLPENILNIYRGILNTLQISIKKSQNIYELQENGVEGICHASYVIQENKKSGIVTVTKSKDLNKCQEKISENQGSAYTQLCETCQLKGKNLRSVSTYSYAIKNTKGEAVIIEVVSKETHQFTPFNELDGAAITESRQHLVFLESKEQSPPVPTEHLVKRGTLRYQFSNELQQMPMQLTRPSNNDTNKIATALENLIQMNQERAHPDAPQRFLQFIQLLRSATLENLQSIWKKNAGTLDHRRWIWDALPTAATPEAIQFIQTKIEEGELMHGEAAKALIFVLHSIKADCHGVDNATVLLSSPYMQRDPFLRRVTLLAYGTLVNKYCATLRVCPDEALRPLHELVVEAGSRGHEYETILGLKAIGNAGQPSSLKRIQKLLPGFGTVAGSVSNRIHIEAVMALRNIAKKEPRKVQAITLQIFMNKRAAGSLRMKAFIVLLETQPSLPLIVTVADTLSRETNIQVTSFAYSYMKSLAGSSEPELQSLAASCNIAIKRLNQKCDALGYRYSKGFHFGTFKDKLLAGINANVYLLKKSEGILPTTAIINIHLYGLGVSSDFLEIGIHIEGEWRKNQPHQRGPRNERIARKVPGWKSIPTTKPLVVAWIKLFGQELSFTELHQEDLQMVKKEKERIERLLAEYIVMLQNGVTMHWTKPLLVSEIRHIVPTSLGLPMEMAFYYTVVSAAQAKMKLTVRPSNFTMVQLLNTSIQTDVQFTSSSVKDVIAVMGINTPLIQTGVEVQLKTSTVIPVDFTARVNLKKSNVKIERLPWQQEDQLFSARSRAFAFARNIEDLAAEKVTPLLSREEFRLMNSELSLVKNSTLDQQDAMEKVLPLAIPRGSVCSAQDTPDVPSPTVHQACTSSNTFGVEVCYKTSIENTAFTTDSPLYKMVGDKSIEVTIKPVTTSIAIKKLQVELQLHRGDQIIAGVRHLMRKSNGSDSAFPEPTPPDGKLALLKLKKIFSGNARHQDRQEHRYTMGSSTSSSQASGRRSAGITRESNGNKKQRSTHQGRSTTISEARDAGRWNVHKYQQEERKKQEQSTSSRLLSSTQSKGERYRRPQQGLSKSMTHHSISSSSSSAQLRENYSSHPQNRRLRTKTRHSISSSSSSAQLREEDGSHPQNRRLRTKTRHSISSSSSSAQLREEDGSHPQNRRLRPKSHHSISSSSPPAQSREEGGARYREGSSRKVSNYRFSSSSSSAQPRRKKGTAQSSHLRSRGEKCNDSNCRNKHPGKPAHRPSIRNATLPSTTSVGRSRSISSSAQSRARYGVSAEHETSSSSSSSESSSSRSSSRQPKHRRSQHSGQQRSGSSSRVEASSSSMSWHHRMVNIEPSTKRRTSTRTCKNGKCIHEYTKSRSTTIHRYETDRSTWIFNSKSAEQEGANPNIFQLRFKPSESSLSENKGRLSYESSSESSSRSGISFSSSSSSSSSSQQSLSLADSVPPLFSLLTRAIMADNKEKGYQTKAYMDNSKEQRAVQLFVDELQEEGSWRACIGAEMPTVHRAVALLKWGKNCQDYKIGAKATTGHFQHHPAVLVKAQWDKIPQTLKEMAAIVADQLAGIAFMLGFSERHQKSAAHQISVITAATSQRTLDVVVKTPKHVYSRQSIHIPAPLPFNVNSPSVQQRGLFVFADFSDIISATSTAECTVVQNQFTPFTKDSFEYQMPEGCAHVLVQDCTPELQFITLIRRSGESLVVQLYLPYSEIEIQATTKGKLQLSINRTRMSIASLPFSGPRSLAIERSDNGLKIKAPELGLEKLSFDGKEIKVAVVPWMAESTCGLCGRSDSQKRNEYLQPNKRSTNEILKFAHSWLVPGENCKDDCKLMKRMVKLENSVKIHGQESKCYTIDPVLRCQIGCSPVKIAPVVYSFHCLPADSHANLNDERLISANFGQKSEDLTGPVEAHTACSCPSQCS
ncbi:vitellogenin-like isoform X1 [Scyliorhinus canicula]|uniref:vitellogenin-like isoform X1 n=1 Tax=Scyliorhinus canicula TaxID=7830 RepID=UPI0018F43881|nr:vitellogenin-like isoform X1 [Scyliorhinus canicula]